MEIFKNKFEYNLDTSIILGFFDGIHSAHKKVIKTAVDFAKKNNTKTLLITFRTSPAEYFKRDFFYIYSREYNYSLIEELGVDYLLELNFEDYVNMTASDFLIWLKKNYSIKSISTGFNYTFGTNREGNPQFLNQNQDKYGYKYLQSNEVKSDNETISSTLIRNLLKEGLLDKANKHLDHPFILK